MIFFIDFLRALAMALITNSHYTGVYPTDLIANGGLLGDVLFFAVSGYCLYNVRLPFHKWYFKRIMRIYPIIWVITLFYFAIGAFTFETPFHFLREMILPMGYHFVSSIMLLYIPYYVFVYLEKKYSGDYKGKFDFTVVMAAGVTFLWLLVYFIFYDRSYYHIDTVREPMIRFLYFEAMLVGYYIRKHNCLFENKKGIVKWILTAFLFGLYFASKMLFVKKASFSQLQIINQFILLALLFGVFMCVASLSSKLDALPEFIKKTVSFLAKITLEIYVVQSVIIDRFRDLRFPINWFVITAVILVGAVILHFVIKAPSIIRKKFDERKQEA